MHSPDFTWLATCDKRNQLMLTNLEERKQIEALSVSEAIYCITFSADSKKLIAGVTNRSIKVWNLQDLEGVDTFTALFEGNIPITSLIAVETNQVAAASSFSSAISVIDVDSGKISYSLNNKSGNVSSLVACRHNLLSFIEGDTLKLLNLPTKKLVSKWKGTDTITACAVTEDGKNFAFGEKSGKIFFLSLENYGEEGKEATPLSSQLKTKSRPEDKRFRSALGKDKTVRQTLFQVFLDLLGWVFTVNWWGIISTNARKPPFILAALLAFSFAITVYRDQSKSSAGSGRVQAQNTAPLSSPIPSYTPEPFLSPEPSPPSLPLPSPTPSQGAIDPYNHNSLNKEPYNTPEATPKRGDCIKYVVFFQNFNFKLGQLQRERSIDSVVQRESQQASLNVASFIQTAAVEYKQQQFEDPTLAKLQPELVTALNDISEILRNYGNGLLDRDSFFYQKDSWAVRNASLDKQIKDYCGVSELN